jgi:hypothetical protein
MYHIFFIIIAVSVMYLLTIVHSGKDKYEELKNHIHRKFMEDLAYTIDIVGELTPKEADFRIDEFEERWKGYVTKAELNNAIGKLIEAQVAVGF